MSKTIVVTGSSGFIGGHLTKKLRDEGNHVIGIDIVKPRFEEFAPDEFYDCDLRDCVCTNNIFTDGGIDHVYNMACLMGGMGFIGNPNNEYDVMVGSSLIAMNVLNCCVENRIEKIFYPSSACIYPEFKQDTLDSVALKESDAYPAHPDMPYGWQKLFAEQVHEAAKLHGIKVRVARFHNVYGTHTIYDGNKEKAPAAICRKISYAADGELIEIWGDGKQIRSFMFIEDCLKGIELLMDSNFDLPLNIGSAEAVSINELAQMVIDCSGKNLTIKNIAGNQGVRSRNSDNSLCREILGWEPTIKIKEGISKTYQWIHNDIHKLIFKS